MCWFEGIVTTIAGNSKQGNKDGKGTLATFQRLAGIVSDIEGNLFVTDFGKDRIRKISKEGKKFEQSVLFSHSLNCDISPMLQESWAQLQGAQGVMQMEWEQKQCSTIHIKLL